MLALLLSVCHIAILTLSWGWMMQQILKKMFKISLEKQFSIDTLSIFGFCWLTAFTTISSIFIALDSTFQLSIFIFSISLFVFKIKAIIPFSSINALKLPRIAYVFLLFFSLILFYETAGPTKIHDTGSYHLTTINWIEQYPTVPGLGNLYGRLALNSSMFSVSTLFILRGVFHQPILAVNLFFFLLILFRIIKESVAAYDKKQFNFVFFHTSYLFILFFQLKAFIASASPDLLLAILIYYTFLIFINLEKEWTNEEQFMLLAILTFTIPILKISQLFAPILFFIIAYNQKSLLKKHFWWVNISLFSIFIIPWLIKSVILSGYLIYPFFQMDLFSFDWKIPKFSEFDSTFAINSISSEQYFAKSWARIPDRHFNEVLTLPYSEWVPQWFRLQTNISKLLIIGAALSPISLVFLWKQIHKTYSQFWIFTYLNLIYWALNAPDTRFAHANIVLCFLMPLLFFIKKMPQSKSKIVFLSTFTIFTAYFLFTVLVNPKTHINFNQLAKTIVLPTKYSTEKTLGSPSHYKTIQNINFQYIAPLNGACDDTQQPCTPYPNPQIEMRGTTVREGFRIRN